MVEILYSFLSDYEYNLKQFNPKTNIIIKNLLYKTYGNLLYYDQVYYVD